MKNLNGNEESPSLSVEKYHSLIEELRVSVSKELLSFETNQTEKVLLAPHDNPATPFLPKIKSELSNDFQGIESQFIQLSQLDQIPLEKEADSSNLFDAFFSSLSYLKTQHILLTHIMDCLDVVLSNTKQSYKKQWIASLSKSPKFLKCINDIGWVIQEENSKRRNNPTSTERLSQHFQEIKETEADALKTGRIDQVQNEEVNELGPVRVIEVESQKPLEKEELYSKGDQEDDKLATLSLLYERIRHDFVANGHLKRPKVKKDKKKDSSLKGKDSFCKNPVSYWLVIVHTVLYVFNLYGHVPTQSTYVQHLEFDQAFSGVILMMTPIGAFLGTFIWNVLAWKSYKWNYVVLIVFNIAADFTYVIVYQLKIESLNTRYILLIGG